MKRKSEKKPLKRFVPEDMRRTAGKTHRGEGPVKATHSVAIGEGSSQDSQEGTTGTGVSTRRRGKSPGSHGGKSTRR